MTQDQKLKQIHQALKRKFKDKNLVLGHGAADAKVVFVGTAPGEDEEREGRPIAGPSAKLLNQLLRSAGLTSRNIYVTNVLKYRLSDTKEPTSKEIKAHAIFLKEEIKSVNPQVVITLGNLALTGIGLRQPLDNVHGRTFNFGTYELLPTFHPIQALENPDIRTLSQADFVKLKDLLKTRES